MADYAHAFDAAIQNKTGFHVRPATNFVDLAKGFQADIRVRLGDSIADGKSLISLLQLGVERGATIRVSAQGPDAAAALDILQVAIASGLGDEEEEQPAASGRLQPQQDEANTTRFAPAVTTDGHRVEVAANINYAVDVPQAVAAGAEGVGLMRTEFLFLARPAAPSEDEQFAASRDMVLALDGRPLIIRTLDIGGDKEVPYLNIPKEDNAFLGVRGIRFCLAHPDLFISQLRAIYGAAVYGPLSIMFPMVATLEEWEQARVIAEQVRRGLNAPAVPMWIMIEVPSAVLLVDHFAQEVDFFSIGTNDLT